MSTDFNGFWERSIRITSGCAVSTPRRLSRVSPKALETELFWEETGRARGSGGLPRVSSPLMAIVIIGLLTDSRSTRMETGTCKMDKTKGSGLSLTWQSTAINVFLIENYHLLRISNIHLCFLLLWCKYEIIIWLK